MTVINKIDRVKQLIECKREEMHQASEQYGMGSEITLQKSQDLDELLNEHQKLLVASLINLHSEWSDAADRIEGEQVIMRASKILGIKLK